MGREASSERQRYWQDLIHQQQHSGLSIAAFCRQHDLSQPSFYAWRARLTNELPQMNSTAISFVPLSLPASRPAIFTVRLPNGVQLDVPSDFDEAALTRLVRVVRILEPVDA